jgi:HTH-type transcriptional regulator/antitoxin HipB
MTSPVTLKDATQLGKLIRGARKKQKVTQMELADFTGLHRNGIAKIEAGTVDVKVGTLLRLASLLRLDILVAGGDE